MSYYDDSWLVGMEHEKPATKEHVQEIFESRSKPIKAIVCSCGFATTYSTILHNADRYGWQHFERMHEAHKEDRI